MYRVILVSMQHTKKELQEEEETCQESNKQQPLTVMLQLTCSKLLQLHF